MQSLATAADPRTLPAFVRERLGRELRRHYESGEDSLPDHLQELMAELDRAAPTRRRSRLPVMGSEESASVR
jgi:hypothetical protein